MSTPPSPDDATLACVSNGENAESKSARSWTGVSLATVIPGDVSPPEAIAQTSPSHFTNIAPGAGTAVIARCEPQAVHAAPSCTAAPPHSTVPRDGSEDFRRYFTSSDPFS